jgi:hypothetical protein
VTLIAWWVFSSLEVMKVGEPTTEQILYRVIILSDNYQLPLPVALFTILPQATQLTNQSNAVEK